MLRLSDHLALTGSAAILLLLPFGAARGDITKQFLLADCETGVPIGGARIEALNAAVEDGSARQATTDGEGFAQISPLRWQGEHRFRVSAQGYRTTVTPTEFLAAWTTVTNEVCLELESGFDTSDSGSPNGSVPESGGESPAEDEPDIPGDDVAGTSIPLEPQQPRGPAFRQPLEESTEQVNERTQELLGSDSAHRFPVLVYPDRQKNETAVQEQIDRLSGLLLQQAPAGNPRPPAAVPRNETGRTVARNSCSLDAFFGFWAVDPNRRWKDRDRRERKWFAKGRLAAVQPEVTVSSNLTIDLKIKVMSAATFPGEISFRFTRNASGATSPSPFSVRANDMADLSAKLRSLSAVPMPAPQGMAKRKVVVEEITAEVVWDPDNGEPCALREELRVRWEYAHPRARPYVRPTKPSTKDGSRTVVAVGPSVAGENFPDGTTRYTAHVQTFFAVADISACCCQPGEHAVIQFVRHDYILSESPQKESRDKWNLDILDSEVKRAGSGGSYDPTYTHNPRGSDAEAAPVVYSGPNPAGDPSIVQVDRPGLLQELYKRFHESGGRFRWQFYSLLVCKLSPGDAADYAAKGRVAQWVHYEIVMHFPGGKKAPTVRGRLIETKTYKPCRPFSNVLKQIDRQSSKGKGKLRVAFEKPRRHQIVVPK